MSAAEATGCALACLLLVPAWIAVLRGRDAWPYSCYPMFSDYRTPERVTVFRIAVERAGGKREWWRPRYAKQQEILGREFQELARAEGPEAERRRREADLAARLLHRVRGDSRPAGEVAAICVVRRRVEREPDGALRVREEVFRRYPMPGGWHRG